jgi:outer membrane protein assembly factor BamD (BamD/ComL family)
MSDAVQYIEDASVSCFQCASTEWIVTKGVPSFCKYCKHPYPKYVFQTHEEKELYDYAKKSIQSFYWSLAKTQLTKYVKAYPQSPYGYLGLLQVKHKFTFEKNESTQEFELNRQDISPVRDITHDELYKQGTSLLEQYNSLDEINVWKNIALYLKKSIQDYERLKNTLKPCEVFISFKSSDPSKPEQKTKDDAQAKEIYEYLTTQGGFKPDEVFYFSENHRTETGGFEGKIFYRLETAKVLVLLGSKMDYITAKWVRNEWSRYYLMIEDRLKHPDSLMLALENTDPSFLQKLPNELKSRAFLDTKNSDFLNDLTQAIRRVIEANFTPKLDFPTIQFDQDIDEQDEIVMPNQLGTHALVISDINELESRIARLEASWKSPLRTDEKIKSLIASVLEINPSETTALKYELLLTYRIQSIDEIKTWNWLKKKEDSIPLLKYLGTISYEQRFSLITRFIDSLEPLMRKNDERVSLFFGVLIPNMSINFLKFEQQTAINQQLQALLRQSKQIDLFFSYTSWLLEIKENETYSFFIDFLSTLIKKQTTLNHSVRSIVLKKCIDYYTKNFSTDKTYLHQSFIFKRVFFKFLHAYLLADKINAKSITELFSTLHFFNDSMMTYEVFYLLVQVLLKKSEFKLASSFIDIYIQTYRQNLGHFYVFRFMAQYQLNTILDIFTVQDEAVIKTFTEKVNQEVFGVKDDHLHQAIDVLADFLQQHLRLFEISKQEKWIDLKPIKNYFKTESIPLSNTSSSLKPYQSLPAWKYDPPLFSSPYPNSILYLEGAYLITGKFIKSIIKNTPNIKKLVIGPKTAVDLNGYDQSLEIELQESSKKAPREFSLVLMPGSIVLNETLDQATPMYKIEVFNEKDLGQFSQFLLTSFNTKTFQMNRFFNERSLIGIMQTAVMNQEASSLVLAFLGTRNDMILKIKHQNWLATDLDGAYLTFLDENQPIQGQFPKLTATVFPALSRLLDRLAYAQEQHDPHARLNRSILLFLSEPMDAKWKTIITPLVENAVRGHYPSLLVVKYFQQHYPQSIQSLESNLQNSLLLMLEEIPKSVVNTSTQQPLSMLSDAKFEELKNDMMGNDQDLIKTAFKQLDYFSLQGDLKVNQFLSKLFKNGTKSLQANLAKVQKYSIRACLLGNIESCRLSFEIIKSRANSYEILNTDREQFIEPMIAICKKGAELKDPLFIENYDKILKSKHR